MRIQASIAGYKGKGVTLLGNMDDDTGILVVAKILTPFRNDRAAEDITLITDVDLENVDFMFTEDHIHDAIRSYYVRKAISTIDIVEACSRFNPDNRIEQDGVNEHGRRYRISPDIDNGQVAILAMCALLEMQKPLNATMAAMSELEEIYSIHTI